MKLLLVVFWYSVSLVIGLGDTIAVFGGTGKTGELCVCVFVCNCWIKLNFVIRT